MTTYAREPSNALGKTAGHGLGASTIVFVSGRSPPISASSDHLETENRARRRIRRATVRLMDV
ncbi:hypothetical protein [Mycolicibacterium insubricum]|uniref:hypothetical protein n=1 Tax=Mycolicibacterium insubricum TaxID=444597 RepID=UPI0013D30CE3|nr:hypothetical protein [Mycolicibacterium insubricum]MCV7081441.1 hypothetical protein [Mycolicibacterium insubricum]